MNELSEPRARSHRTRNLLIAAFAATLVLGAAGGAYAGAGHGQSATRGPNQPDATFASKVGHMKAVVSAFNDPTTASSTTPAVLPGMSFTFKQGAGTTIVVDARFSAETACYGGTSSDWCVAEILVDGVEAAPGDDGDYAIDSTDNGNETSASWEGHAMERLIRLTAGSTAVTHTVQVVGYVTDFNATGGQTFWTGERTLVIDW